MGETLDSIKNRRSIRKFKDTAVSQDILDTIIEAGLYAPSSMGRQDSIIIQVTDKKVCDELSKLNAQIMGADNTDPFYNAPAVLIVLAKKDMVNRVYDGSLVMQNLMLASYDMGLGSIWIHRAKEEFETDWGKNLLKSLGIEEEYEGIGHCAVGYVDGDAPAAHSIKDGRVYYIK